MLVTPRALVGDLSLAVQHLRQVCWLCHARSQASNPSAGPAEPLAEDSALCRLSLTFAGSASPGWRCRLAISPQESRARGHERPLGSTFFALWCCLCLALLRHVLVLVRCTSFFYEPLSLQGFRTSLRWTGKDVPLLDALW
jgi:hypothetical protein